MSHDGLDSIFSPRSIAVVGVSDQAGSVGGAVFANLRAAQFNGSVFPMNRKQGTVLGETAYGTIAELPETPDLVVVCTPAATVPALVHDCGERGVPGMIVISAGFQEAGAAGCQLEADLRSAKREYPNLRRIGPNCLGVLRPAVGLNASFAPVQPRNGRLTFLSQSGALCTAILDWSIERKIGFATCVSVGNMLDVGMGDLIDYFARDEQTDALLLYIEGLDDAPHFLAAARACSRRKPIVAYKAGRFEESAAAAASHTGALASVDAVYDAAFRRVGIERVHSIEELFDCARLLVTQNHAPGDRLAVVTNAGGPGVMARDAWLALGGCLAKLQDETVAALNQVLPANWSHGNPLDVLGDAPVERFRAAIDLAVADDNVDALLVIVTPQTMTEPARIADTVVAARDRTEKPIIASWIGGPAVESGRIVLRNAGVPVYDFPEEAVQALNHLVSTGRMRAMTRSAEGTSPEAVGASEVAPMRFISSDRRAEWRAELARSNGLLGEVRSKQLLADYGIPVVPTRIARSADEAVTHAEQLGFPIVLKILSPDISHKTDVGGVVLNLASADSVRSNYERLLERIRERNPDTRIECVAVQPMISVTRGVELLFGMTRDPQFGPVFLLGAGGITAELQKDSVLELAPLDDRLVDQMLRSLRLFPLLEGYRGRPGVDLVQVRDVVARFFQLAEDLPELAAAEINPLLATAEKVVALDARMILVSTQTTL